MRENLHRSLIRRCTAGASIAIVGTLLAASSANAGIKSYCNINTAPMDACSDSWVYQHFQQNSAQFGNGQNSVGVCQKLTVGGVNQNKTCGSGYTESPINNWGEMRGWAGNNSSISRVITGTASGSN